MKKINVKKIRNTIVLNDEKYKIRLIKDGNEWDRLMEITNNDDNIVNWRGIYSWCMDKYHFGRVVRGYNNDYGWSWYVPKHRGVSIGFRPVLEPVNPDNWVLSLKNGNVIKMGCLIVNGYNLEISDCKNNINWIYFDGKLVADRNLVTGFSIDDLNEDFHFLEG